MTALFLLVLMHWAQAAEPALLVQHGRVALENGDTVAAIDLARKAEGDPEARALLFQALVASGQGARALVEAEASAEVAALWSTEALEDALGEGEAKEVVAAAKGLIEAHPDHPELLSVLWEDPTPPSGLRRLRARHIEWTKQELDRRPDDALFAWRARALFLAANWPLDAPHSVLQALGEPEALDRRAYTRHERTEAAKRYTNQPAAPIPGGRFEQVDVTDRAAEIAFDEHRYDAALAWWQLIPNSPDHVEGQARALMALDRPDDAVEALDAGISAAVDPWWDDRAGIATARRASQLVRLLEVRAQALAASNHPVAALGDQATADLLAGRTETSPLEDRVRTRGLAMGRALKDSYPAPASETALNQARAALEAGDAEAAAKHATAAIFLFAWVDAGDWRLDCAEAHAIQARALDALEQPSAARVAWGVALLLRPEAPADWWLAAGEAHAAAGHDEVALARMGTAAARSGGPVDRDLTDLVEAGLNAAAIAQSLAIPVPAERTDDGVRIERGQVYRFNGGPVVGAASGSTATKLGRPPGVGERMPPWSTVTETGPISGSHFKGRAVVLLFWVAQCDTCLQALQESGPVARSLREGGRDVAVVAVSMDAEERYVETLRGLQRSRVTLAHDPKLGFALGVRRVPTMWIVDPGGTVRYVGVGWHGPGVFERALRRALQE